MKRHITSLLLLTGLLLAVRPASGETIVGAGSISDTVEWEAANGPFRIQGDIQVLEGSKLIIGPECQVVVEGDYQIFVTGALDIRAGARIEGEDLGGGLHAIWKGIRVGNSSSILKLISCEILHARIALDLGSLQTAVQQWGMNSVTFENNLTAIRCPNNYLYTPFSVCSFINNTVAVEGTLQITFAGPGPGLSLGGCQFTNNDVGIRNTPVTLYFCTFANNDTAAYDIPFSTIDSCAFTNNTLGVVTHSSTIRYTGFSANKLGLLFTDRTPGRDTVIQPSVIYGCGFDGNAEAVMISGESMFSSIECSAFRLNGNALILPARIQNPSATNYLIHKNYFLDNIQAFDIRQESFSSNPIANLDIDTLRMQHNVLVDNSEMLENTSITNINFFNNYIPLSKTEIESVLRDGSDTNIYGLVNYTVSQDSNRIGNLFVSNKVEDVVKHNDYDTAEIIGGTYSFVMCPGQYGFPTHMPEVEKENSTVFPNPFNGTIHLNFHGSDPDIHLYSLSGKEMHIRVEVVSDTEYLIYPNDLSPGIYFLRIGHPGGWESHKLQKLPH